MATDSQTAPEPETPPGSSDDTAARPVAQSGGVNVSDISGGQVEVGGDVVGRDKVEAG